MRRRIKDIATKTNISMRIVKLLFLCYVGLYAQNANSTEDTKVSETTRDTLIEGKQDNISQIEEMESDSLSDSIDEKTNQIIKKQRERRLLKKYLQPKYEDPIIEVGSRFIFPETSITDNNGNEINFTNGDQIFLTIALYWKWLAVSYSHPMKDYTNGYSFRFSPLLNKLNLDLNISKIQKYKLSEDNLMEMLQNQTTEDLSEDTLKLDGLETKQWNLNAEWMMNKKYSSSTAYSQSYSEGQKKSAGSLLIGATIGQDRLVLNPSSSRSEIANEMLDKMPTHNSKTTSVSLGCGYGYNFALKEGKYVIGALFVPYLSAAKSNYVLDGKEVNEFSYGIREHTRFNFTYQNSKGFLGMSIESKGFMFHDSNFEFSQHYTTLSIYLALKLGEFGIKSEKIPGNKILDFIGNIL